MKRRTFLVGLTATSGLALAGAAAMAETFADAVISQLTRQGFSNIAVETTWLGRLRILGNRQDGRREIILNPRTGEVLRDTWQAATSGTSMPIIDDIDHRTATNDDSSGKGSDDGDGASGSSGSDSGSGGSDGGTSGSDGSGSGGDSGDDNSGGGGSGSSDDGRDDKGDDKGDDKEEDKPDDSDGKEDRGGKRN